jgi:uncharacterized integral membrane protein
LLFGLVVAVIVVSFGVKNMAPVSISYFRIGTYTFPLFFIMLATFAVGFLVAWVGGLFDKIRLHRRVYANKQQVRSMEKEIEKVRQESGRLLAAPKEPPAGDPSAASPPSSESASGTGAAGESG